MEKVTSLLIKIHTYIHSFLRRSTICMERAAALLINIQTYIHKYIHTYIHTHIHIHIHTFVLRRSTICMERAAALLMKRHAYTHTYIYTQIHAYIHAYTHTYIRYAQINHMYGEGSFAPDKFYLWNVLILNISQVCVLCMYIRHIPWHIYIYIYIYIYTYIYVYIHIYGMCLFSTFRRYVSFACIFDSHYAN